VRTIDRVMRAALRVGIGRRGTALLETRGRRSGQSRVTPVTNGLDGAHFWIVTEHGVRADYVRNLLAEPHARVNADGEWRTGSGALGRTSTSSAGRPRTFRSSESIWTTEPRRSTLGKRRELVVCPPPARVRDRAAAACGMPSRCLASLLPVERRRR
jgi:deazaflavin-dependent oxidoreductase (nitroreductase family)